MAEPREYSLDDKYLLERGRVALSGIQALVRLPLDQHRADRRAGLRTATLISGYRGSPLGGYDVLLQANQRILADHQVRFLPGVNEDLGATAVFGSQLANKFPRPKYDGVLGIWYGKGPGVDRSGDAFRHANLTGVGRYGGVLAVAGDDPASKSSTVPSASEVALSDAQMPVLFPADVQDLLDLGLAGFALSRYSGLWVGFKVTTNVADEFASLVVDPDRIRPVIPSFEYRGAPWQPTQNHMLFPPYSVQLEQEVFEGRLEAARRFAAANRLNRVVLDSRDAWLGIVAAGKTYLDVRESFTRLGFSDPDLERLGIRLFRVGMLYPLEAETIRAFAAGLEEVLVIEEKRPFLESGIRDALFGMPNHPRVTGKTDDQGRPLVPGYGELETEPVARILMARLATRLPAETLAGRLERLAPVPAATVALSGPAHRLSYFCSGCPHNRSTVVPEGSIAAAGIGCHGMAITMDRIGAGFTHMGAEGAQWVGASFFTETPHLFQNMGDGTLFHSGTLAIRQAVAAGVTMTYKVLYNGAVAMTGGQAVDGGLPVPELTRALAAEGVAKTVVVTDEPRRYRTISLAPGVEVRPRERLDQTQRELREIAGVTVLIYDQHCAADLRRKRKRGEAPVRPMRVFINERICEGCGDCGAKSNCLSVLPVETEFGRKTQIHQSSCNTDYSCLEGDCPAFVTVVPDGARRNGSRGRGISFGTDLPGPPARPSPRPPVTNLYLLGIGGTGVVTINHILGTAAVLEGKAVRCLDQTGLSQKGGSVVSHLKIFEGPTEASNKIGVADADGYLGFDVLTAADAKHLIRATPDRTVAVISSSHLPTGLMVRNPAVEFPADSELHARIDGVTRAAENVYLDADAIADHLFGSHLPANLIVVGAGYQRGLIPLAAETIEQAIRLNGTAAEMNVQAFRAGRRLVAEPAWIESLGVTRIGALAAGTRSPSPAERALIERMGANGGLKRLLEIRVPDLTSYQNLEYASQYLAFVERVLAAERGLGRGTPLAEAVARSLHKLMAYKDEYEVARLALDPEFDRALTEAFGPLAAMHYRLHPPLLRALGLKRKLALGRWFRVPFRVLRSLRRLRGTWLDPFGYDGIRRVERGLIGEYRAMIERQLNVLSPLTHPRAVRLAALPDVIRGYDEVKRRNVERYRALVREVETEAPVVPSPEPALGPAVGAGRG
jgi:indolepyruvate ferredoxin oxidoreductase